MKYKTGILRITNDHRVIIVCNDEIQVGDNVYYFDFLNKTEGTIHKVEYILNNTLRTQITPLWKDLYTPIGRFKKILIPEDKIPAECIRLFVDGKLHDGDNVKVQINTGNGIVPKKEQHWHYCIIT